jgi:hypothetical protein
MELQFRQLSGDILSIDHKDIKGVSRLGTNSCKLILNNNEIDIKGKYENILNRLYKLNKKQYITSKNTNEPSYSESCDIGEFAIGLGLGLMM